MFPIFRFLGHFAPCQYLYMFLDLLSISSGLFQSVSTHSSHLSKCSVPLQLAEYVMINPSILHPYSQTWVNLYSRESFCFSFRGRSDSFSEFLIILSCLQDLTSSFILSLTQTNFQFFLVSASFTYAEKHMVKSFFTHERPSLFFIFSPTSITLSLSFLELSCLYIMVSNLLFNLLLSGFCFHLFNESLLAKVTNSILIGTYNDSFKMQHTS